MIVFRRTTGQAIRIGNNVRIVITEVEPGKRAHIGIEAPLDTPVHRLEVYEHIRSENQVAAGGNALDWLQKEHSHADESGK